MRRIGRAGAFGWAGAFGLCLLLACDDGRSGAADAVVGCPPCATGEVCGDDGACVPDETASCAPDCDALGWTCGEACGVSCGACADGQSCSDGQCTCTPVCPIERCAQPDSCDGACPPCPAAVGCADCVLRLVQVERSGAVVTLAVDYAPPEGAPHPTLADLRIVVTGDAELLDVASGEALMQAQKDLFTDPQTGRPFRVLSDGTIQLLVLSTRNAQTIGAGRWLFLRFRVGPAFGEATGPAQFAFVPRAQILAPVPADEVLWGTDLGAPVVVWP